MFKSHKKPSTILCCFDLNIYIFIYFGIVGEYVK